MKGQRAKFKWHAECRCWISSKEEEEVEGKVLSAKCQRRRKFSRTIPV